MKWEIYVIGPGPNHPHPTESCIVKQIGKKIYQAGEFNDINMAYKALENWNNCRDIWIYGVREVK